MSIASFNLPTFIPKTEPELKQLAQDIVDEKVFTIINLRKEDFPLSNFIWMPLTFMTKEDLQEIKDKRMVFFYEYYDKRLPRNINGYPIFMSMQFLSVPQAQEVIGYASAYAKMKKEMLEVTDNAT